MPKRILRSLITLASVAVAYQVYALLAVPWMEPTISVRENRATDSGQRDDGKNLVAKYQRLLAAYFPADHWTQVRAPIVIMNDPGLLVLDEYHQHEDNQIELVRCALLFFATPLEEGGEPPTDAIVVEAPQGAIIQFDDDFNPAGGELGKIVDGQLKGPIIIRSDMHEAGPDDDLLVETSNLRLNADRLESPDPVRFRLGRNIGSGRRMHIRLLAEEGNSSLTGIQFSGIRSLSVLENVQCQLAVGSGLLDGGDGDHALLEGGSSREPVQITCTGPFEFELIGEEQDYVATFHDNVELWQFNPTGPANQMACKRLSLQFEPERPASGQRPLDVTRRQRAELGRLHPYLLEAVGEPVIIVSPSREFDARGARIRITIPERKIALDGGDVQLRSGPNVVRAPAVFYTHPADDAGTRLGSFRAAGPGMLDFLPNPNKSGELLRVTWQESVQLTRENDEPVLSLAGRPQLTMRGRGSLAADDMRIYLREFVADANSSDDSLWTFSGPDDQETTVIPDRLSAVGNVVIDSPQLTGRTHSLSAWFRYEPDYDRAAADENGPSEPFALPGGSQADQPYAVQADQLELEIALRGRRAEPTNLSCDGNVVFRELHTKDPADAPLVLHGQRLTVEDIDTGAMRIAILGRPATADQPPQMAELTARGVTLISQAVYLNESQNRAWIEGGGEAHIHLNRDLAGNATPYSLKITWRDRLDFDGRQVSLLGDVLAEGPDNWLQCDQMIGTLARPLDFGDSGGEVSPELAEVDCRGHVVLDRWARDEGGPTSHDRVELSQLAVNQFTGKISGSGPGWLQSVHFGQSLSDLANPTAGVTTAAGGPRLNFLHVKFQRGLTGNLHDRLISFQQRVRAVYGPVDSWEQQLDPDRPETLPPTAVVLRADELTVNEDPTFRRGGARPAPPSGGLTFGGMSGSIGPIELAATRDVQIDGANQQQQSFRAVAHRATYSQAKNVFQLQGDGRTPATIFLWEQPGTAPQEWSAQSISYNRTTNQIDIGRLQGINYAPIPRTATPAPTVVPIR